MKKVGVQWVCAARPYRVPGALWLREVARLSRPRPEDRYRLRFEGHRGRRLWQAVPWARPADADSFSGGEATVVPALTNLGFTIIRIDEDWSEAEVEATVRDYFEMLHAEAAGAA